MVIIPRSRRCKKEDEAHVMSIEHVAKDNVQPSSLVSLLKMVSNTDQITKYNRFMIQTILKFDLLSVVHCALR